MGNKLYPVFEASPWKTWQRPTLPRLETQYHWRGGVSRPSSGWIGWGTLAIATKSSKEMRSTTEVVRSKLETKAAGANARSFNLSKERQRAY